MTDLGQECVHAEVLTICIEGLELIDVCTFVQGVECFSRGL